MNKYQQALNNCVNRWAPTADWNLLKALVEKAIPKKPDVNINNGYCPKCHQAFGLERTKQAMIRPYWLSFCPCCGQALDWSEK
nr:MAG TPA: Transcription initiation factor IIE, alpha FINGER, Transcription [Caudoviricetes sp.]